MRYFVAMLSIGLLTLIAVALPGAGQTIPPVVYLPIIAKQPTVTPTATTAPTVTATPTPTSSSTPTATEPAEVTPTATATTALLYICDRDAYSCSDFSTQAAAQAVFDYCAARGFGDIHKLDQNNDGEACESLPLARFP